MIQPKGIFFTRPVMGHYLGTKDEMTEGSDKLFKKEHSNYPAKTDRGKVLLSFCESLKHKNSIFNYIRK